MKTYKIRSLIPGYKLGLPGKVLVAIKQGRDYAGVEYQGKFMPVKFLTPLTKRTFLDKWGRGEYTLNYYEFKPIDQQSLF